MHYHITTDDDNINRTTQNKSPQETNSATVQQNLQQTTWTKNLDTSNKSEQAKMKAKTYRTSRETRKKQN